MMKSFSSISKGVTSNASFLYRSVNRYCQHTKQKVVICGGGNGSHVLLGLSSLNTNNDVYLLSLFDNEADKIRNNINKNGNKLFMNFVNEEKQTEVHINDHNITNDSRCMENADIIVIALPAFSHALYLDEIAKNVGNHNCLISMLPGCSGLECDWHNKIMNKEYCEFGEKYSLLSGITLPWNARIKGYGNVDVLATKSEIEVSMFPRFDADQVSKLSNILGPFPKLIDNGHIINMSLGFPNLIIHSCILYGQWKDWDGEPVKESPLFYQGINEETANLIMAMCDEVVMIGNRIAEESNIYNIRYEPMYKSVKICYANDFKEKVSFYETMTTNPGYVGLRHPVKAIKTYSNDSESVSYVPDWNHRYLTEDIPFGLAVIKGYGLMLKNTPETPVIDMILKWTQNKLSKEYFVYDSGNVMAGKDIHETRAPQRYNFTNLTQIL